MRKWIPDELKASASKEAGAGWDGGSERENYEGRREGDIMKVKARI